VRRVQPPVGCSFPAEIAQFNRFTTLAAHVVIRNGCNKPNVIETTVDQMSFFCHNLDKSVRITAIRTCQKVLRLDCKWRSFHVNSSMTWLWFYQVRLVWASFESNFCRGLPAWLR